MRKKVGIIKRVSCIGLIFLLSINSFAAVVSDNDGSAFITKAEFDALKSSFQSQIDSYNQSIDSKIDGAIASYLSGIKLSAEEEKRTCLESGAKVKSISNTEQYYKLGWPTGTFWSRYFRGFSADKERYASVLFTGCFTLYQDKTASNNAFNKLYITNLDKTKKIAALKCYDVGCGENLNANIFSSFSYGVKKESILSDATTYVVHYGGSTNRFKNNYCITDGNVLEAPHLVPGIIASSYDGYNNLPCDEDTESQTISFNRISGTIDNTILLCNTGREYYKFIDFDNIGSNFSNDSTKQTVSQPQNLFSKITLNNRQQTSTTDFVNSTITLKNFYEVKINPSRFYEGFCSKYLTNWNQIYVKDFDGVALDYGSVADSTGKKHLMTYNGLPLCDVKKDNRVEYLLDFENTTDEYDIWVKLSAFADKAPDTEAQLETNISGKRNTTIINKASENNYITLKSGDILIINETSNNGYVFIKWRKKGATDYGGGTLISTGVATVINLN